MRFEDFMGLGQVRKSSRNENLARSLLKETEKDLEFFNTLSVSNSSARKLVTNYYDFLRSILEAITALDGYKVYSHEAFTYYLKEKGEDILSKKFDRFRLIRNRVNYYGESVEVEEAKELIDDIKKVISILIEKYLGELK